MLKHSHLPIGFLKHLVLVSIIMFLLSPPSILSVTCEACFEAKTGFRDHYMLNVSLNNKLRVLSGYLILKHFNRGEGNLNELCFKIYPNSKYFRDRGGGLEINEVKTLKGEKLGYYVTGGDGSDLKVILGEPLSPGSAIEVNVSFTLLVPETNERLGYYDGYFSLGNWYPILAVYEDGKWVVHPYINFAESFYSEIADYDVYLKVDKELLVASTGELEEVIYRGETKTLHFRAEKVRDFALVIGENLRVEKAVIGNITVYSYFFPEDKEMGLKALKTSLKALKLYGDIIGFYPYSEFKVVEVPGWYGGMEYPCIVFITEKVYKSRDDELLELVV